MTEVVGLVVLERLVAAVHQAERVPELVHEDRGLQLRQAGVVLAVAAVLARAAADHHVLAREVAERHDQRVAAGVRRAGVARGSLSTKSA